MDGIEWDWIGSDGMEFKGYLGVVLGLSWSDILERYLGALALIHL